MAKNYKSIYDNVGDSSALNQSWYAVEETTRGVLGDPVDASFFFTRAGGSVEHTQPKESSDHRSGRHNTDIIIQKKETSWSIPTYVNIDTSLGAPSSAEVDPGIRLLWKSLLGYEDLAAGALYDARNDPSITFSLFETGDKWQNQIPACFVEGMTLDAPGDGTSGMEWSGGGADRFKVGIGLSTTDNNLGNTVTLATPDEAKRFPVGAKVMIVQYSDGVTRSTDTAAGSYRLVTATDPSTGIVTLDGAALADADGTLGGGVLLSYGEPESPTGIADIQTGLVGSIGIDGLGGIQDCVRSFNLEFANNHERVSYCYGTDALAAPFFVAAGRLDISVSVELNLNDSTIEWLYDLDQFTANDIDFVLGDSAGRHLKIDLPKTIFDVPSTTVGETGSIPFTAEGMCFQTALDAADECTVSYI
jgi:hypothetical protein